MQIPKGNSFLAWEAVRAKALGYLIIKQEDPMSAADSAGKSGRK